MSHKNTPTASLKYLANLINNTFSGRVWLLSLLIVILLGVLLTSSAAGSPAERQRTMTNAGPFLWSIEVVEDQHNFLNMGPRSLAIEENDPLEVDDDRFHLVYGGEHLYYAYYNGTTWSTLTIDSNPDVGQYTSMAYDEQHDIFHVSYFDARNGTLKYIKKSGGVWGAPVTLDVPVLMSSAGLPDGAADAGTLAEPIQTPEPLPWVSPSGESGAYSPNEMTVDQDNCFCVGLWTSIALDSNNLPYISYYDAANKDLKFMRFNGWTWEKYNVPPISATSREGKYSAIAIDAFDNLHFAYLDDNHDDVRYAYYDWNNWHFYNIEDGIPKNIGGYISIAMDSTNHPHISYYGQNTTESSGFIHYAKRNTVHNNDVNDWTVQVVHQGAINQFSGRSTSLWLQDDNGSKPRISFFDFNNKDLMYAVYSSGTWNKTKVDDDGSTGLYTSLVLDNDDKAHIAYLDLYDGWLHEAYVGNSWDFRNIDEHADVGKWSTLALDTTNKPHIAYVNDTADDLKYAKKPAALWATSVVSPTGVFTSSMSIDTDSTGKPHIAFYDSQHGNLRYARWTGTQWEFETVDNPMDEEKDVGNVGMYPSIFIGAGDIPHISYYAWTDDDPYNPPNQQDKNLKYAKKVGGTWYKYTIDYVGDVGKYNSIAVDGAGNIFISYYYVSPTKPIDDWRPQMKYYNNSSGYWTGPYIVDDIEHEGLGQWTSLALNSLNEPLIAYYDDYDAAHHVDYQNLKVAHGTFTGSGWAFTTETVDNSSNIVGWYASLDIDTSTDTPYVCYYDATDKDLKLAHKSSGTWYNQVVDSQDDVGEYCSLEVDPSGATRVPHISYYDATNMELKYASAIPPLADPVWIPLILR